MGDLAVYYNEHDPKTAAWLRELIKAGLIADGYVDERSIELVRSDDVRGFAQCHFFAGIGGWSYALRLAGWDDSRAVWTGSCPCQPFSTAGQGRGKEDARHLWPQFRRLIRQCRPAIVFGEQVASKAGRIWLSSVQADLEALAYRTAGADLCGPSVGAFDIRQRLWFVAESRRKRRERQRLCLLAGETRSAGVETGRSSEAGDMGNPNSLRESSPWVSEAFRQAIPALAREAAGTTGRVPAAWSNAEWIACRDGRYRPVEPGTFPLAYGLPARVVRLRGYGNAIKPQVAAAFIQAADEALREA